jgi:hypothetical protein
MKKNKQIEELLDRWGEGNMSIQDLSDELYILFDVSNRRELLIAYELKLWINPTPEQIEIAEQIVDMYLRN